MDFIFVALATFGVFVSLQYLMPFRFPVRLNALIMAGVAYGLFNLWPIQPHVVEALAMPAVVAGLFRVVMTEGPEPWSADDLLGTVVEKLSALRKETSNRIPRRRGRPPRPYSSVMAAPYNQVGSRVPRL